MSDSKDLLLRQTRLRFPNFAETKVKIAPIEKGGSDRKFYRVGCGNEPTIVLIKYNRERAENQLYVEIARFLNRHEIRAPKIFFHDESEGLIWLEDLGEADLWSFREDDWLVRRAFYQSALDEIARLHALAPSESEKIRPQLSPAFDAALYRWEQHYFFENCLGRVFHLAAKRVDELAHLPALAEMAERLGASPRVLVHRDFQSQNIILRERAAYLIDFQGMRPGLAEYDLASLLYDPYVSLTNKERDELFEFYREGRNGKRIDAQIFHACAIQRLMQALGAYGFLGLARGHAQFLRFIPVALKSLEHLLAETKGLEPLAAALAQLPEPAANSR